MSGRRYDLVTLDLDGTLLPGDTVFAAVLRDQGLGQHATATASFRDQWALLQPLALADIHRGLRKAAWLPGIGDGVRRLREAGVRACVLTEQPSTFTDFLGRWGLTDAICSPVKVKDGKQVALDARLDKLANLRGRLAEWGIPASRVLHVGDGPDDVPVFEAVGGFLKVARPTSFDAIVDAALA